MGKLPSGAEDGKCKCGSEEFYEGPQAMDATNIKCVKCGRVYNYDSFFGMRFVKQEEPGTTNLFPGRIFKD